MEKEQWRSAWESYLADNFHFTDLPEIKSRGCYIGDLQFAEGEEFPVRGRMIVCTNGNWKEKQQLNVGVYGA